MTELRVGPVLTAGVSASAVAAAIHKENPEATVEHSGGYLRVLAADRCRVTRQAIERELGRPFTLPRDLELIMPSFRGKLRLEADAVIWEAPSR
ncbi:MAG TPA: MmoB/DmpM family protein [Polyangiales bacterium]|nr:MmoB/DmpM family protein [Polyangiales bacterium]